MGAHFEFLKPEFLEPIPASVGFTGGQIGSKKLERLLPTSRVLGTGLVMAIGLGMANAALANPIAPTQANSVDPAGVKQSKEEPISADAFPVPSSLRGQGSQNPSVSAPARPRSSPVQTPSSVPSSAPRSAAQATPTQSETASDSNRSHQGSTTANDFPVPTAIAGDSPDNSRQPALWSTRSSVTRRPRAQANPLGTKPPSVPVGSAVRRGAIRSVTVSAETQLAPQRPDSSVAVRVGNFPQPTPPTVTQAPAATAVPRPNSAPVSTGSGPSPSVVTQAPPKKPAPTVAAQPRPQERPFTPITQTPPAASTPTAARLPQIPAASSPTASQSPLYGSSLTPPPIGLTPQQADLLNVPDGNAPIGYAEGQSRVFRARSANPARYRVVVLTPNEVQQAQIRSISPDAFPTEAAGQSAMQAGSFSDIGLARELENTLRQNGMRAVIEPIR